MPASRDSLICERIEIDVNKEINTNFGFSGHMGGDYAIMESVINYLNGDKSSISITSLNDSINSHLVVFASEEARKQDKVIKV